MGLIGSSFLSNLVTPPLHWQEQEVPVYVIPDNIQLSEVHHLRLNELGLAIGIPFQITQSNPNERLLAKIMESEAIRSVVTIVEDSVELREFTNSSSQSAAEALTTLLAESSPGNTTGTTTNNNQLKLLFQYTAMEEFELKIEIYVKLSNNVQKIR